MDCLATEWRHPLRCNRGELRPVKVLAALFQFQSMEKVPDLTIKMSIYLSRMSDNGGLWIIMVIYTLYTRCTIYTWGTDRLKQF